MRNNIHHRELVLGFGKGRGLDEISRCFTFYQTPMFKDFINSKIPYFKDTQNNLICIKVRHADLEWMLKEQHIDIALGSSVWFNNNSQAYESYHLNDKTNKPCRLSVIAKRPIQYHDGMRVVTKFPKLTQNFFAKKGYIVQVKYMSGCHENALMLDFADVIIDIIETGNTIKKLNLIEIETIKNVSHKMYIRSHSDYEKIYPYLSRTMTQELEEL
ncbi:hypothetical protein [Aquimarina aquimarini]|uniref:hypothetical protein n=1 Tax=Aquimarina aquimarini TaxID=1191734 RepID=UPI000D562977|nr:hypothetical protein [Aquimarina aquimarini]